MTLTALIDRGFDECSKNGRYIRVGCSQCAALVLQGVACHETGCPNARKVREEESDEL